MRIQVSKREGFARVNKWIKWDDGEPKEDDEPEIAEEPNFGTFYGFNLRQRIQSRLLDWYLNIHYSSSSSSSSSLL